jgi:hypothetical protein
MVSIALGFHEFAPPTHPPNFISRKFQKKSPKIAPQVSLMDLRIG